MKKLVLALLVVMAFAAAAFAVPAPTSMKPGEAGFEEIPIGEEQQVGPYNVAAVYFQAVDMYPAGKN
ncbi:MAG: iron transporter, partial [Synergistaceae bacterium]|nr:iron transporter [Synergistaceae bacterium]